MLEVETNSVTVETEILALVALAQAQPTFGVGLLAGSEWENRAITAWVAKVRVALGVCRQRAETRMQRAIVEAVAESMSDFG